MPLLSGRPIATLCGDAEPPERATYGGRMARNRRFQHGSLFKRGTRTKVWVARWWEDVSGREGKLERVRRSEILGTVAEIPTRRQADQILSNRLHGINSGDFRPSRTARSQSLCNETGCRGTAHTQVFEQEALRVHSQRSSCL